MTLRRYHPPAYSDNSFPEKQVSRDNVAVAMAKYLGHLPAPKIFVLPAYEALCAKTIDEQLPNAAFYGCDYYRTVVEHCDAVNAAGKRVDMQLKRLWAYINDNADILVFDAAFVDFKARYTTVRDQLRSFAERMLQPVAVLAITAQRGRETDVLPMMREDIEASASSVTLESSLHYKTSVHMTNAVFLVRR